MTVPPQPIIEYLSGIGASPVVVNRLTQIYDLAEGLLGPSERIVRSFISEYVDNEGTRIYENLWFFTETFILEAHSFLAQESIDCIPYKDNIGYVVFNKTKFSPPVMADASARAVVMFTFNTLGASAASPAQSGQMKASGTNCDHLYAVLKDVLMPNLRGGSTS